MAGRFKKRYSKPSNPPFNQKSRGLARPCISMPTLISCSTNISSAKQLDSSIPDYAEIESLLEDVERQDHRYHPKFATSLPRRNSTSSESYTRLYPANPTAAVPIPTSPRPIANDVSSASSRRRRPPPPPVPSLRDRRTRSRGKSASRHSYEAPEEWDPSLYQPLEKSGSHSDLYEDMSGNRRMRSQTSAPLLQRQISLDLDEVWTTYMPINLMSLEKEEEFEKPKPVSVEPAPSLPPRIPLSHPPSLTTTPALPSSLKSPPPLPPSHTPSLTTPPPYPPSHPIPSMTSSQPAPLLLSESLTTPSQLSSTQLPTSSIKSPTRHKELQVSHSLPPSVTTQRPPPPPVPSGKQPASKQLSSVTSSKPSAKVIRNQSVRSMTKPELPIKPPNLPQLSKPTQSLEPSAKPSIKRTASKPALSPRPAIPKSKLSSPPQVTQSSAKVPQQPKTTNTKNSS